MGEAGVFSGAAKSSSFGRSLAVSLGHLRRFRCCQAWPVVRYGAARMGVTRSPWLLTFGMSGQCRQ